MSAQTCFVIMPIGEQEYGQSKLTAAELRQRYTDLIKEAILAARPTLSVSRSDESATPGGITTDVFTQLMHADFVVADITFPNPNVFYELGIRHASRYGTILIKGEDGPGTPFDIVGERHIPYSNTATGLKALGAELAKRFAWFGEHPVEPDSEFQKLAALTKYAFPRYRERHPKFQETVAAAFAGIITDPEIGPQFKDLYKDGKPSPEEVQEFLYKCNFKQDHVKNLILGMLRSGDFPI